MRRITDELDYLAKEMGTVLTLCEWIDRQEDPGLSASLPTMHALLRNHFDALVEAIDRCRSCGFQPQ